MQEMFEKIIEKLEKLMPFATVGVTFIGQEEAVKVVRKVAAEYNNGWIPVTYHETTYEDGIDKDKYPYCLDCKMPDGDKEILVCTKNGYVCSDTAFDDDGYYLDSGYDWIDDVIAWQPLPQPYTKIERNHKNAEK